MVDVAIVGVGNVGGALAGALAIAGYDVAELIVRDAKIARRIKKKFGLSASIKRWPQVRSIASKIVFVCTDDSEIPNAVESLGPFMRKGQIVVHTSGSLTSSILAPLAKVGCETASMHPLTSLSDPFSGSHRFHRVYFCLEGSKKAVGSCKKIVLGLEGQSFTVPANKKALYHASAVTAAGHVVAVFASAVSMLQRCGVTRKEAERVLLPLTKSVIGNLSKQPPEQALTGTFARLDVSGLERHLGAMKKLPAELRETYLLLGERSLSLLEQNGVRDPRIAEMRRMIFLAKGKRR